MHIGILGGGNISDTHARAAAALPGVTVAACYGSNRERTSQLASRHGAVVYDDLERFLSHQPMDIVAIGSPSGRHAEQGIAAARHGLHVLSEKPLDITTKRADELIDACKATGVKLGVFFQDRLRPAMVELKRLVDDGGLGKLVMIAGRVRWYRPPEYYSSSKWRGTWALDGGGALMNQAIHTVDLVQWLYGPVSRVSATVATRVHDIEVEDTAAAVLDFTSGAIGTIEASTSLFPGYPRRLELTGSEGTVIVEGDNIVQRDLRGSTAAGQAAPPVRLENVASPVVSDASAHQRVLEDFIAAIREDRTPATDGLEARRSVELVETIYAAARKGRALAPGDV